MGTVHAQGRQESGSSRAAASLVIAGRLVLLLLAGLAAVSAFVVSRKGDDGPSNAAQRYACPMHPEVVSSRPEECPVCRMALELVRTSTPGEPSIPSVWGEPANTTVIARATRRVLAIEVRAPAWLEPEGLVAAVLYRDEAVGLRAGERGLFFRSAAPAAGIAVRATAEAPSPWDESTSRVRFRLDPGVPELRSGEVGWVQLEARPGARLVVPAGALLYSSRGPYVLVEAPDGTFRQRSVGLGRIDRGLAVVTSGLRDEERIASGNAFFLDAERRLQSLRREHLGTPPGGGVP